MAEIIFIDYDYRTLDLDDLVRAMVVLARTDLRQFLELFFNNRVNLTRRHPCDREYSHNGEHAEEPRYCPSSRI